MVYAFDSNIIVHLMIGTQSVINNRDKARREGARFAIPPVVNYEIQCGLIIKAVPKHIEAYNRLCANSSIEEMTLAVWVCAANIFSELYAKRLTVEAADILIAAFCITNGYTLVTNDQHFRHISNLQHVDWVQQP